MERDEIVITVARDIFVAAVQAGYITKPFPMNSASGSGARGQEPKVPERISGGQMLGREFVALVKELRKSMVTTSSSGS